MKTTKIKDERVQQLNNKIQSEAYILVLFLALASAFIKTYVMGLSFSYYVSEFVIILLSTLYTVIRSMFLGYSFMNSSKNGKILSVAGVLGVSLVITIINGIRNYSLYGSHYTGIFDGHFIAILVIQFVSSVVIVSVIFALLYWFNMAGQKKLEKKLNREESE